MSLSLNLAYVSELADRRHERAPTIRIWRNFGAPRHLPTQSVSWEEGSQTLAKPFKVDIQLDTDENGALPADAAVHFEVFAQQENHSGDVMRARVGHGAIWLAALFKNALANKDGEDGSQGPLSVDLVLYNYADGDGKEVRKGQLLVRNITIKSDEATSIKFAQPTPFSFVPQNEQFLASTMRNQVARSIIPYTDKAAAAGFGIDPVAESLKRVHAPFYNTTLGVTYGAFYWLLPQRDTSNNQEYFDRLLGYALARANRTGQWFRDIVWTQLDEEVREDKMAYMEAFTECVRIVGEALTIPSTALPYVGDSVDLNKRLATSSQGFLQHDEKKVQATESWDCAICRNGGDCEDLAHLIHRTYRGMRQGSWSDDSLSAAAQAILKLYTGCGSLGSVLSAALGNDVADPKAAQRPYIIGTQRDDNVKVGAHMWYELVPTRKFVTLLRRTTDDVPDDLEPPGAPAWAVHLPHMVLEGTGRLDPLQRPRISYLVKADKSEKLRMIAAETDRRAVLKHLITKTRVTKLMQMVRTQRQQKRLPNARINHFYRRSTGLVTIDFLEQGYSVLEFMWTRVGNRVPVPDDADELYGDDPLAVAQAEKSDDSDAWDAVERALTRANQVGSDEKKDDVSLDLVEYHVGAPRGGLSFAEALQEAESSHISRPEVALALQASAGSQVGRQGKLRYGVDLADKLEDRPLMPHVGIMPKTPIDAIEARAAAEFFKNLRPIALPGDDDIANEMMAAEDASLSAIDRDPSPARAIAEQEAKKLQEWATDTLGGERRWPTFEQAQEEKLSLITLMFARSEMRGDNVRLAIQKDFGTQAAAGVVRYGRVRFETPLPGRTDVVMQFYCSADKISK